MEREKGRFIVFEWSIENFSCWNAEIHGNVIESPKSCNFIGLFLELYPRGHSGDGEHLLVQINGGGYTISGELSYIGPDGSILCRQQVDSEVGFLKLPSGPKFETVVAQMKKNEALHKDNLTVRYLIRWDTMYTEYLHTQIRVFEVSFRISRKTLDGLESKGKNKYWIYYPQGDEKKRGGIQFCVSKDETDFSKIIMVLEPVKYEVKVFVLTRMSVLNIDDELVKTERDEHVLRDRRWEFSITLAKEEMKALEESQTSLILSLSFIPSINFRHSLSLLQFPESKVDVLPSNVFMPYSTFISAKKSLKSSNKENESATTLAKQLMCLYQDHDFSDFRLKCGDVTFPVHKNILSARSPVFKTMLSCDMKEAASGCMDIEDLDISTLSRFLTYLYTGGVEDLQGESALKLYYAADKYQVPSLKTECADILCDNVSISDVCDILSLANKHQDDRLNEVAREFILNNYNEVLSSEEWKSFMKIEPLLAVETVTHFAEKRYVRKSEAS